MENNNDFQVAYRWRLNNNKYLYISDNVIESGTTEGGIVTGRIGGAPFICKYNNGDYYVSYFTINVNGIPEDKLIYISGDTYLVHDLLLQETNIDEWAISNYCRKKYNGEKDGKFKDDFEEMSRLMSYDEDGKDLTLLSYENYYNIEKGDTCSVGYDSVDCNLYDLDFSASTYKIPYGKEPVIDIGGPYNIQEFDKTLKNYRMTIGLPQGPQGERGTFEDIVPQLIENNDTTYFPIFRSNTHPYTTYNGEKNIGLGVKYNESEDDIISYTIDVTNEMPNPEYGYYLQLGDVDIVNDFTPIRETIYYINNFDYVEGTQYAILTFTDENTIEGGDGFYYNTLLLKMNNFVGEEMQKDIDYNAFLMAFKWNDETSTPYTKNSSRFIFNTCGYRITKYKKENKRETGDIDKINLIFGNNVNLINNCEVVYNSSVTNNGPVKFEGNTTFGALSTFNGNCIYNGDVRFRGNTSFTGGTVDFGAATVFSQKATFSGDAQFVYSSFEKLKVNDVLEVGTNLEENENITKITLDNNTPTIKTGVVECATLKTEIGYETSDIRMKNIIEENPDFDIEKILNLTTIYFTFKDDEENKKRLGVIAQEIRDICPEIVWGDSEGVLHVEYNKLAILLLYCIKDIYKKIN